jgi:hypothetical protein
MALIPESADETPRRGLSGGHAKRTKPFWLRLLILFGIIAVSLVVYVGVVSGFTYQFWGEPPSYEGVASRSVEGEIKPGQTLEAGIDVSFDMSEVFTSLDEVNVQLTLTDPSPRAAVFGGLGIENVGETRPALVGETAAVETLDVPYACEGETGRCLIPVDVRLGNLGTITERWVLTASITHRTGDQDRANAFEVPSLRSELVASQVGRDDWVSPGPIAFEDSLQELVAYSVTVDTSVNDPSLFEVIVTEPWQYRGSRIEAIIGPQNLSWSVSHFEPSSQPVAQQAQCDKEGCQLNLVALFIPHESGDWWIPIVRPSRLAPSDMLKHHSTEISIDSAEATNISGLLGARNPLDNLTLHIEAEPDTTQAALSIMVYPEGHFEWLRPQLQTDDGQAPQMYRWFDLECDASRCIRDVEVTWDRPDQTEPTALFYWITAVGGTGNGLATPTSPSIEVNE